MASAVCANKKMEVDNNSLALLEPLIGRWTMEVQTAQGSAYGITTIEWIEGRGFIRIIADNNPNAPPSSVCLIGRDQDRVGFDVLYVDERGLARSYQMSFAGGIWRIWRDQPGSFQRFQARLNIEGNELVGSWERSSRGASWEHDFHIAYRRVE